MTQKLPTIFLAGCQKTASTWIYKCFKEHPGIFTTQNDAVHYFTIHHHEGLDWYAPLFADAKEGQTIVDTTPSYIRHASAAQRIYDFNPQAKFIFSFRNPIERAFSHYWHLKRREVISYTFEDAFEYGGYGAIDMFDTWVKPGLYMEQLQPFLDLFPKEQIKVVLFDDLKVDPAAFIKGIFEFMEVDASFVPEMVHKKSNSGSKNRNKRTWKQRILRLPPDPTEYQQGIAPNIREHLRQVYQQPNQELGAWLQRDLSHWQ
ncbi:MAG: sulfotransferase [Bacteroidota bacterium]